MFTGTTILCWLGVQIQKKSVGKIHFYYQFRKIINRCKNIGYNMDIMRRVMLSG